MNENNIISSQTQQVVEKALGLEYEHVFDMRKAWRIFSGTIFLSIPFRLILTEQLPFWSSIGLVVCIFLFVRLLIGDPVRRQLTLESVTRLNAFLYSEMTNGDSTSIPS